MKQRSMSLLTAHHKSLWIVKINVMYWINDSKSRKLTISRDKREENNIQSVNDLYWFIEVIITMSKLVLYLLTLLELWLMHVLCLSLCSFVILHIKKFLLEVKVLYAKFGTRYSETFQTLSLTNTMENHGSKVFNP